MAKIRGIKPETWTDENFVELSPYARLLWIGMWNHACDNGHLQDKSKQLKMRVLPTDDVSCAELLREIEGQGLIERADGWITIPNLPDHQKPHKHWYVICDKPGCIHPAGMTYGIGKTACTKPDCRHKSTVDQPLSNGGTPVDQPVNNGGSTADGDVDGDGELMVMVTKEESGADAPDAAKSTQLALVSEKRPDVERICVHLAEQIEARGSKRPAVTARWRNEARLLMDRDGRTEEQVHACIRWLFTSDHRDAKFWRTNVRSMPKLRSEYDRLRELADTRPTVIGGARAQAQSDLLARAMARAEARERGQA